MISHTTIWSECCPPDLNHKESPKIYHIQWQKELPKIYEIKCECRIACLKICQKKVSLGGDHSKKVISSEGFQTLTLDSQNDALRGPAHIIAIINNGNDIKHLILDSFVPLFFAFWLWWRILHRYVSTNRRRYAQKPLHGAAFTRRYSYTERFVHTKKCTQMPLHTERFLHCTWFYAKKEVFTHRCFVQRCFCAHE